MKKLILILAMFPLFSFGQTYYNAILVYQDNIKAEYYPGDTIDIYFKPTQTYVDGDSILMQFYDGSKLIVAGRSDFKTSHTTSSYAISIGYTQLLKLVVPNSQGLRYAKVGVGKTPNFTIKAPLALLDPFLPENKDREFDFYNQSGSFIVRCKISELNPGFYISNGFKLNRIE